MSRVVELNFESRNILSDGELKGYMLNLYNCNIDRLYVKQNRDAENGVSYVVKYDTTQSIDDIIYDVKYLCFTLDQNAIACKILSDDITAKMMISNNTLDIRYKYFCDEYFVTADIAQYSKDCTLIYKREI